MPVSKGVWGIDIGQCALKAIRLEMIDGKPTATAFDYVEHPKILSQPDAEPDLLIREALDKFLSRNQIKIDDVAIGIAGQSGLARFVKLPPVEEKKIAEIVKFEAKQQIPFPLEEVVWDFQKIAGGEVMDGFAMETEVGLFAMKRDVISRYMGYFAGSRVEVHCVQMSPLALVNYATYEILKKGGTTPPAEGGDGQDPGQGEGTTPRGKKRCVVVLDIGTEASNLIITDGGKIIWQRPIPLGGNNFTRALTKELKLTFAKAEHLKRNAAKSPELPAILKALKPVLTDFVGEVQRSLGYFTNTHRDAHVAYMVGLGSAFRLPGLQKYLAEKLTLEVKKPDKFTRLAGDAVLNDPLFKENVLTFPVAYGLALQGLGEARLTTNLLPPEIRTERLIRAKKPYAVAAAAMLLLGTAGLALGVSKRADSYNDQKLDAAMKEVTTAKNLVASNQSEFAAAEAKKKDAEKRLQASQAGQRERLNWARFEEVFTAALPRPGYGGNLDPDVWGGPEAERTRAAEAIKWYTERLRGDWSILLKTGESDESTYLPRLARVNVEAVHARYVKNVNQFLIDADKAVFAQPPAGFNESIARWMKDDERTEDAAEGRPKPKGIPDPAPGSPEYDEWHTNGDKFSGWVIEVRGFTDFPPDRVGGDTFIGNAIVRNIQRFDDFTTATDKVRFPVLDENGRQTFYPKKDPEGNIAKDAQGNPIPDPNNPVFYEGKVARYVPGGVNPVREKVKVKVKDKDGNEKEVDGERSRVSHAFIYHVWSYQNETPGVFKYIYNSYLDQILNPGGQGQGQPGGFGMPPGTGGAGGAPPPAMAGMPPGGMNYGTGSGTSEPAPAAEVNAAPWQGLPSSFATQAATGAGVARAKRIQHEFVVMFIWREPITPSAPPPPAQ